MGKECLNRQPVFGRGRLLILALFCLGAWGLSLAIVCGAAAASAVSSVVWSDSGAETEQELADRHAVVLSDPADPYYPLAQEIAGREELDIVHSLDDAFSREPSYLLWVVSPSRLSDAVMVELGQRLMGGSSPLAIGFISGSTLEAARALWLRASDVKGRSFAAAHARNESARLEAGIERVDPGGKGVQPLTTQNLLSALQEVDYLTFTGHGGKSYLRLDEETRIGRLDLPRLRPIVVGTASCSTFRLWEKDSIALAFVERGAAAYAGFVYSPNEGYLMGEFDGLPFRYTWPNFPIGRVVQVQSRGALQGYAAFPYYHLLGDPRLAFQPEAPYRLVQDRVEGGRRYLAYEGAPAGVIPIRIADGASYEFVEVVGSAVASDSDPFYNSRLQMLNAGGDKYLLYEHRGGDFSLVLQPATPALWSAADALTDGLDHTLIYGPQTGGDLISLAVAVPALLAAAWLGWRRRLPLRAVWGAVACGAVFAAMQAGYGLARAGEVTVTSKLVALTPLSVLDAFLLAACGAFLFVAVQSRPAGALAVLLAALPSLSMALFGLGMIGTVNLIFVRPQLGVDLYNYSLTKLALVCLAFHLVLIGTVFVLLRGWLAGRVPAGKSVTPSKLEAFHR